MSSTVADQRSTGGPCGTRFAPDKAAKKTPRLVLGLGGSQVAVKAATQLRALGWEVTIAATGEEARRLAVRGRAHVLVLAVAEGQLLDTAKLMTALPKRTKVVLVGSAADGGLGRVSTFLGAAGYVTDAGGVESLVKVVLGICGN